MVASGAYGKIWYCTTRNQYETVKEQATQGARFFDLDMRQIGNRVDTCHGVAHGRQLDYVYKYSLRNILHHINLYRPQKKFGEGNVFTGVCLFTWGRGGGG